jgi:hypothetical protein
MREYMDKKKPGKGIKTKRVIINRLCPLKFQNLRREYEED